MERKLFEICYWISFGVFVSIFSSCAAKNPYYSDKLSKPNYGRELDRSKIDYELFLVGDTGAGNNKLSLSNIVDLIKTELVESEVDQSVIFLGNSISENGFPDEEDPEFAVMDKEIKHCIKVLKDNTDKVYFIPGNSEWFDGQNYTSSALNQVENYIESNANDKNIFAPSHGCGEPKLVELTDDLVLMMIDSQWILEGDRSGERKRSQCDIDYEDELITYIEDKLSKHKKKNVIIAGHHPIYSNGLTGGNYGIASNLLPLPILGSVITGIKKISGGQQKFSHPQYQKYRASIGEALKNYEGVIFASAHDKNLQYHLKDDNHFVIAGSGSDVDYVRSGADADFAYMEKGFAKITHTKDLELWLEFYVPDANIKGRAKSVFKKRLYKKEFIDYTDTMVYHSISEYDKVKKVVASSNYSKRVPGMGETYRKTWGTALDVPVFLLEEEEGGLTPIQQGGGFETKSLRVENAKGQQWVLRTVDKDIRKLLPSIFRGTFAETLVQDGVSATHPYAAFVIPKMAEAAKIYHANPRLVWLPKQKALGDYNLDLGDRLILFEERAGGNLEGHPSFGNVKKAISTLDLIEKLIKDYKTEIDEQYVLRCRLFDLLIGDWDRDDDQWRWGEFKDEETGKNIYRAIPRDRDQAFFKNDGFLNYVVSRPYFNPQLRKFDTEIDDLPALIYDARYFDRSFISQLNKVDFIEAAAELQRDITDKVIEDAFSDWPKEIYEISGPEIIRKLKQRRKDLPTYAEEFYKFITKEVTIVGTNGKNIFDITAQANDKLEVNVYHLENDVRHLIWTRTISGEDCDELRLFGMKGKDVFNFKGSEPSTVKVQLVGGGGNDLINNNAEQLKILVYDRKDGINVSGNKIRSKLLNRRGINRYDRMDWELDRSIHFPMLDYYTDEGIGLSYNFWWERNGFRKSPYQSDHTLSLSYLSFNNGFIARYNAHWVSVFGPDWDIKLKTEFTGPVFTQFYYGLGNEYINYEKIFPNEPNASGSRFFIVKGSHVYINPFLVCDLGNNKSISIDPSIEYLNIRNQPEDPMETEFIFTDESGLSTFDFEDKLYTGIGMNFTSNRIDNSIIPNQGYKFYLGVKYRHSMSNSEYQNVTFESNLTSYIPFSPTQRLVFASFIGGAYTLGAYEFFHANYLSTRARMRGFRRNRFGGDGILYMATDLRYKILQGEGGLRTGVGIFGSFDIGRTFLDGEVNDVWHTSYGGGIFLTPLDLLGVKLGYYVGREDTQIVIGGVLGF